MKVRARKVTIGNVVCDSAHESEVYCALLLRQRAGEISNLEVHKKFTFEVYDQVICTMKPDFVFLENGVVKIQDAKGFKKSKKTGKMLPRVDREFGIKSKLMKAINGYDIEIV